tara:strand:- start:20 stop:337 length:318 start_codon:yes stop_codon:yes gene_type:complete
MKIKYNKFYYNPLPENLSIRKSDIHGYGIFASVEINKDEDLGSTHIKVPMILGFIRTPLGGFINHSKKANCVLQVTRDWDDYLVYNVFTTRKIKKNEEILLEYGA